jgi:hypothetical protein
MVHADLIDTPSNSYAENFPGAQNEILTDLAEEVVT